MYLKFQNYKESQMNVLVEEKFQAVEMQNPLKESITEDILTNEIASATSSEEMIGYVQIPSVGLKAPIYQGMSNDNLDMQTVMKHSTGHEPGSYLPGEDKQIVLTGHREEQFKSLKDVKKGDLIIVVIGNNTFLYEVAEMQLIKEDQVDYVRAETDEEQAILYTCYPFTPFTPVTGRYVIKADRISEYTFET